jgi:hypothetical protein
MATKDIQPEKIKWEIVYEDDDGTTSIWRYDMRKTKNGPYEIDIKSKIIEKKTNKKTNK